jgi:hypothetical protein
MPEMRGVPDAGTRPATASAPAETQPQFGVQLFATRLATDAAGHGATAEWQLGIRLCAGHTSRHWPQDMAEELRHERRYPTISRLSPFCDRAPTRSFRTDEGVPWGVLILDRPEADPILSSPSIVDCH